MVQQDSYTIANGKTCRVRKFDNQMLSTVVYVDGQQLSAQGCAIKDNCLYRIYDRGYCKVFEIDEDFNLSYLREFKLGSYRVENHANCGQFECNTENALLYVAGV